MPSSACEIPIRSEEHTSELQSHDNLVCRLLLEQKRHGGAPPDRAAPMQASPSGHPTARAAGARWGGWHPGPGGGGRARTRGLNFFFERGRTPGLIPFPPPPPSPV